MKRCPECQRDYYDDTLLYCLDDGSALLEGPGHMAETPAAPVGPFGDGPQTAILHETAPPEEAATRAQIHTTAAQPKSVSKPSPERHSFSPAEKMVGAVVAAAILLIGGTLAFNYFRETGSRQISSIAVMPFVNEASDPDIDYLSDGMTETLMNSLAQLPGVSVKARSSVFRYKGRDTDAQTLGRELGVQAILNGRLVKSGDDMSVFLELVDAATGDRIWGERYSRPAAALVSLQNDIARDVSQKLRSRLTGAEEKRIAKNYTENAEAYELYLHGRFLWNKRTPDGFRSAIPLFEKAVALDPKYALAYSGLADCYALLAIYEVAEPADAMPKGKQYAMTALTLDPDLAEAHASLGQILNNYDFDFAWAEREYRKAIELNPNYATAYQWLGEVLTQTSRFDEAQAAIDKALELDPFSLIINRMKGSTQFYAGRLEPALAQMNRTVALDPNFPGVYYDLYMIHQTLGDLPKSAESFAKWRELNGDVKGAEMARNSFAAGGWPAFSRHIVERGRTQGAFTHFHMAAALVALGEKEESVREFQLAYEARDNDIYWAQLDPRLALIHPDPRFKEIMRQVGFKN